MKELVCQKNRALKHDSSHSSRIWKFLDIEPTVSLRKVSSTWATCKWNSLEGFAMVCCFSFQVDRRRSLCIAYLEIHLVSIRIAWLFQKREEFTEEFKVTLKKKKEKEKDLNPFGSFRSCADSMVWLKYTLK